MSEKLKIELLGRAIDVVDRDKETSYASRDVEVIRIDSHEAGTVTWIRTHEIEPIYLVAERNVSLRLVVSAPKCMQEFKKFVSLKEKFTLLKNNTLTIEFTSPVIIRVS